MDNKILTEVITGEFESNGITYIVKQVTSEISRVTKKGSNSFNMLGKVVLEEDNTRLLIFTDIDSVYVIKNIQVVDMSVRDLNTEILCKLPDLINEAEPDNTSLIEQPKIVMPSSSVIKVEPLNHIEFGSFLTGNTRLQIRSNSYESEITIVEINSTNIFAPEEPVHHKVAQAIMVEYADGKRNIVGLDESGHLIYTSRLIEKDLTIRTKNLASGEPVKVLKDNY